MIMAVTTRGSEGYMEGTVGYDRAVRFYFCQYWKFGHNEQKTSRIYIT